MIAAAGFTAALVQPAPTTSHKDVMQMSDVEFDAYISGIRARVLSAWLERAISWRVASLGYYASPRARAAARRLMRQCALTWKARRNPEVSA